MDRGAWLASPWGRKESDMTERPTLLLLCSLSFPQSSSLRGSLTPALASWKPGASLVSGRQWALSGERVAREAGPCPP